MIRWREHPLISEASPEEMLMPETRRQSCPELKAGTVQIAQEACESVAEVTRELGVRAGTLGRWVCGDGVRP